MNFLRKLFACPKRRRTVARAKLRNELVAGRAKIAAAAKIAAGNSAAFYAALAALRTAEGN